MSKTALQLLRRLHDNYPGHDDRERQRQTTWAETEALWKEVDIFLASQTPAPEAPGPDITCCYYCGVTMPYVGGGWVWVDDKRVSCGGPDCVAF